MSALPVADLLCAQCDEPNAAGALFCTGCGTSLRELPAPPLAQRGPACPACGGGNPPGSRFCVTCGAGFAGRAPQGYAPALALAGAGAPTTLVQNIYVAAPLTPDALPLLVRALWFLFVGLWAGQLWLLAAWLLNLTVIGLPLGMWMLNRLPQVMTLRQQRRGLNAPSLDSSAHVVVRVVYFVVIGWWLSLLWMQLAWLCAATIIGLPLSFLMFERVGALTTLADA